MEDNFCTDCGSKLAHYQRDKYDPISGEKLIAKRCENIYCERGCSSMTGHAKWSCWRNKCLGCGYSIQDY